MTRPDPENCAHARVTKDPADSLARVCRDCGKTWRMDALDQHLPKVRCTQDTLDQLEALAARRCVSSSVLLRDLIAEAHAEAFDSSTETL